MRRRDRLVGLTRDRGRRRQPVQLGQQFRRQFVEVPAACVPGVRIRPRGAHPAPAAWARADPGAAGAPPAARRPARSDFGDDLQATVVRPLPGPRPSRSGAPAGRLGRLLGSDGLASTTPGSTGTSRSTIPRPWQWSHGSENASTSPVPIFFRVIWIRPSEVTSATWCRVRSRPRHSVSRRSTSSRLDSSTMSMKSTTMMPPMSRSRSCRTTSSAASRLFLVTVSSRFPPEPVYLPVLTSIDRHRLGAVDDQRAAGRQVDLALQGLRDLLVDAVRGEDVGSAGEAVHPGGEFRRDLLDVTAQRLPDTGLVASSPSMISSLMSELKRSRMTLIRVSGSL